MIHLDIFLIFITMRILSFGIVSLVLLSSCTWWGGKEVVKSPYPSTPLGVSMEIGLSSQLVGSSYKAKGTEPFWAIDVTPGSAVLSRPSGTGVVSASYTTTEDDKWAIIVIKGVKWDFFLNMTKWACSDGMSDTKYAYNASVLVGAESLTGCALKIK